MTVIDGTLGNDTLIGTDGGDIISGLAGNDIIDTGAGTNRIDAGAGDDTIIGGQGSNGFMQTPANGIDGGLGYDTLTYPGNSTDYRITLTAGTNFLTIANLINGLRDIVTGIERIEFADTAVVLVQPNAAPVTSGPLTLTALEGSAALTIAALTNTTDAEGDALSVLNLPALPDGVS